MSEDTSMMDMLRVVVGDVRWLFVRVFVALLVAITCYGVGEAAFIRFDIERQTLLDSPLWLEKAVFGLSTLLIVLFLSSFAFIVVKEYYQMVKERAKNG